MKDSCNVESTACAIEGVGGKWKIKKNRWEGYGDIMFYFLNSAQTQNEIPKSYADTPINEIMENLAYAVEYFSDAKAKVIHYDDSKKIDKEIEKKLRKGAAIVFSYETLYGSEHYNTMVAYDEKRDLFLAYDPWPGNPHCKKKWC